jgi:hypothetical protein
MSLRVRVIGVLMVLAAIALLYPGVTQPVLTLQGELEKSALAEFGIDLLAGEDETGQTRAMLDMFARMLLLQLLAFAGPGKLGYTLLRVNAALSKWSMADVFVMAMLIAFLAGRASNHMGELLIMDARLEIGFWYFSGYCLFAVASGSLLAWLAGRDGAATQPQLSRNETV